MRVSIYDQKTHIKALSFDLQRAKLIVIIVSPYLQMDNLIRWKDDLEALIKRGIRVCVITDLPDEYYQTSSKTWIETRNQKIRDCVAFLESMGIHVTIRANVHTKLVIIDYHILWEGSLNFLSSNPDKKPIDERVPRVDDVIHTMQAYSRHNCELCKKCISLQDASLQGLIDVTERSLSPSTPPARSNNQKVQGNPNAPTRFARAFSKLLAQRRSLMDVKKIHFAEAVEISRMALDSIENGKSTPSLKTLTRSVELIGWKLVIVPDPIVPLINIVVKSYHRAEVSKMLPLPTLPPPKHPEHKKTMPQVESPSFDATPLPNTSFSVPPDPNSRNASSPNNASDTST